MKKTQEEKIEAIRAYISDCTGMEPEAKLVGDIMSVGLEGYRTTCADLGWRLGAAEMTAVVMLLHAGLTKREHHEARVAELEEAPHASC